MKRAWILTSLLLPGVALSSGLLTPTSGDPAKLLMRSLDVKVAIDGPHAEVRLEQIWENRSDSPVEGRYELALPAGAALVGFSLWDGDRRLHGVVIEKTRGKRLYEELTAQALDPGLVEEGDEAEEGLIVLRVAPVPAWGTTRVLLTYDQTLPVASMASQLIVPLAPAGGRQQKSEALAVTLDVKPGLPLARAELSPTSWWSVPTNVSGGFQLRREDRNVTLDQDVIVRLGFAPPAGGFVGQLTAFRDRPDERGFFVARGLFAPSVTKREPHDLVVVLDASPSMLGDDLAVAVHAVEQLVGQRLASGDRFGLVVFNDEARAWKPTLEPWSPAAAKEALGFVRASYVAGGTDLLGALTMAGKLLPAAIPGRRRDLVLVSDGRATRGELAARPQAAALKQAAQGARLFVLGVGDEADDLLLDGLATGSGGAYLRQSRLAAADPALAAFFDKLDGRARADLALTLPGAKDLYAPALVWDGGDALVLGRYSQPASTQAKLAGQSFPAVLPAADDNKPWVGRLWATARVRDLLGRIRADGEEAEWIEEIIALARRHGLVTPYTSFIAAPRALLRPRTFQAGDPILRVETGPEITAVVALFPWGLEQQLEPTGEGHVWETRFLAPAWMKDGEHRCTLVLTDRRGRKLREDKRFTIDSTPPKLEVTAAAARPGQPLQLRADADADVRTIVARLGDGPGVELRWNAIDKASVGALPLPDGLPAGRHAVHVVAEDFARNTTLTTIFVEVQP